LATRRAPIDWQQEWVPYQAISMHVKRAIITSEDDGFIEHTAVDWVATREAWLRNEVAAISHQKQLLRENKLSEDKAVKRRIKPVKIVGGSTITQQLAKNLFLSGDKNLFRKAQELIFSYELYFLLSKQRIFEIYLNNVEWGSGIFGIQAAARYYFKKNASQLAPLDAAKLAVMLPQPLYLQWRIHSSYIQKRSSDVLSRMNDAQVP
jgi:monofunctional biosynthetic peptidoglycan transglycosylase